jgi:hypothetical protein
MRQLLVAVTIAVLFASCHSFTPDKTAGASTAKLLEPEIAISQISSVPAAAEHVGGGLPIRYRLRVMNRSDEEITLKRVTVQSVGIGAYTIPPTSQPFSKKVVPDGFEVMEFWIPAFVEHNTTLGANGPVTLRLTLQFDSAVGMFQETVIRQVSAAGVAGTTRD